MVGSVRSRWRGAIGALAVGSALLGSTAATAVPAAQAATVRVPATTRAGADGLNLLMQGATSQVLQTARYANGQWAPTTQLFKNQDVLYFTDVVQNGVLRFFGEVFTSGCALTLEEASQSANGSWSALKPMPGLTSLDWCHDAAADYSNYMAAAVVGTHVQVVYIDTDGQIAHTTETADGSWTTPDLVAPVGGYARDTFQSVTAASVGGELQVAVVDQTHRTVLHTVLNANGTWDHWGNVLGATGTPRSWGIPIRVSMAGFGSSLQMVVLTNGQVAQYHAIRNPNGSWTHFGDIDAAVNFQAAGFQGTVLQEVSAVNVGGKLEATFASDDNSGSLYFTLRNPNGTWTKAGRIRTANLSDWRPAGVAGSSG
jgi:hypothetical protein